MQRWYHHDRFRCIVCMSFCPSCCTFYSVWHWMCANLWLWRHNPPSPPVWCLLCIYLGHKQKRHLEVNGILKSKNKLQRFCIGSEKHYLNSNPLVGDTTDSIKSSYRKKRWVDSNGPIFSEMRWQRNYATVTVLSLALQTGVERDRSPTIQLYTWIPISC